MTETILMGLVGSTAYGLATESSDKDYLGVFMSPTRSLLGLTSPKETIVRRDPDMQLHELGKFCRLALAANPTILELLFLGEYEVMTPQGQRLVDLRHSFLSARIRTTFGGYAIQQARRLQRDGAFESALRARSEKHGRHCMRLMTQGAQGPRIWHDQREVDASRSRVVLRGRPLGGFISR